MLRRYKLIGNLIYGIGMYSEHISAIEHCSEVLIIAYKVARTRRTVRLTWMTTAR